ncbi:rhomboid family intramembrane serine protease [Faecalicatena contorta]|uniref:rhomboid family intramembrane serine protease n=1 Tax=Faecalicatena contorta TaxID=39482 RepID=UPI001F174985|nr:rhomboid family intramembrane serine protease [Faecalicatena contorta]MCF2554695.1 rhomboid family intramembrane serine protease [Faecalicatena contorta]
MKETYGYQKRPICTMIIAGMNIAVFFVLSFRGMTEDAGFLLENGASYAPYILERGEYYRLFTSMFLHFGFEHLMNNMLMLLVIGWNLERELGKIRFLLIYLCSGLCGNVLSLWWDVHTGSYAVAAGASGAVFGIIGALLYVAIRNHGRVGNVTGRGLLFMAVMSLYYGFTSEGVDNFAHIGGLLSGFLLAVLLYWKTKRKRSGNVWNG